MYRWVSVIVMTVVLFQSNMLHVHALDSKSAGQSSETHNQRLKTFKQEISKNENVITHYVNEEDGKEKTIIWTKGITPPQMGGENSDFKKVITHVPNSSLKYIEYEAPYVSGHGWYDVNKSENRDPDLNLCFAAAASNTLHWWLDQNADYITKYLEQNPDAPKAEEIKTLRHSFKNQADSGIYKIFVNQFGHRQEGYYPDILQDQFINGYYPKPNGGTNDSEVDRDKLIERGPDPHGGFFYNIFGTTLLTHRQIYDYGYDAISEEIKRCFLNGDMVLMTYRMGAISHVVTLWGAEYDTNGKISAVYFSDSDDDGNIGMRRYNVVNSNGKALASTQTDGQGGSLIHALQIISPGKQIWEDKLHITKKQLDLVWGDTEFTYNGEAQKPTLKATNIEDGDEVTLSVQGEQIHAGTYTAIAVLDGASKDYYKLPSEHTKQFTIKKAQPTVSLTADIKELDRVELTANVSGINGEALDGTVKFVDCTTGKPLKTGDQESITVKNGVATYVWTGMEKDLYKIKAVYSGNENYKKTSSPEVNVDVRKKPQEHFEITNIASKRYGDKPFVLSTKGGSGTGEVIFESSDSSILSISGDVATIHKAGSVTITATKSEDKNYNSATTTFELTIQKSLAPEIIYPVAADLTYGQNLSDSSLTGGSTEYGSFTWENDTIVPTVGNQGYRVVFTPNEHTLANYEAIQSTVQNVSVTVNKAIPKIVLTSDIENETRSVVLSASIAKSGNGDYATGSVKFLDCISGNNLESGDVTLENGQASYIWKDVPENTYRIKALYSGDENYSDASSAEIIIDIYKMPQEHFEIAQIDSKTYGDEPFNLSTYGGSGTGAVTFDSSDPDILSISEHTATIHKAGVVTITATKAADETYNETQSSVALKINKKLLTITAEDKLNVPVGSQMPDFTYRIEGFVGGDSLTETPVMEANLDNTNGIGEYEITISGGNFTNRENYQIVYVNGKITIVNKIEDSTNTEDTADRPSNPSDVNHNINANGTSPNTHSPISSNSVTTSSSSSNIKVNLPDVETVLPNAGLILSNKENKEKPLLKKETNLFDEEKDKKSPHKDTKKDSVKKEHNTDSQSAGQPKEESAQNNDTTVKKVVTASAVTVVGGTSCVAFFANRELIKGLLIKRKLRKRKLIKRFKSKKR